jgi:hypothetical protein
MSRDQNLVTLLLTERSRLSAELVRPSGWLESEASRDKRTAIINGAISKIDAQMLQLQKPEVSQSQPVVWSLLGFEVELATITDRVILVGAILSLPTAFVGAISPGRRWWFIHVTSSSSLIPVGM